MGVSQGDLKGHILPVELLWIAYKPLSMGMESLGILQG